MDLKTIHQDAEQVDPIMLSHLIELRQRTLQVLALFTGFFTLFFFYAPNLFHFVVLPLLQVLPKQDSLIATQITSPLLTPINLAADVALLATTPFALFHLWRFVSPGLYRQERNNLSWAIISSMLLFCVGVLFCFYLVLPFMLQFFAHAVPLGVRLMPDISYAIHFIMRMLLLFGVCFQVPLLCFLLVYIGVVELATLKKMRPYIIVAAFTLGMLLTPPDVLSQIMLAVPLCILYELGILLAVFFGKDKAALQQLE